MDILVIGGSGFLGQEVTRQARRGGALVAATFHRHALPIAGVDWHRLDIRRRLHPRDIRARARLRRHNRALFTDDVRCPIHVSDLASALRELAASAYCGVHHVAGADAVTRHQLGVLIARRDGLDETTLPTGLRARTGLPGALDVRLDCTMTQSRLTTRLRGAHEFLTATLDHAHRKA